MVRRLRSMETPKPQSSTRYLVTLSLGALGVVYGDIGTSPLYAFRECFRPEHHLAPTEANILGIVSLIAWSLVIIISIKYLVLVMRADNRGEGGILALMSLVGVQSTGRRRRWFIVALGLFGAALLYGDGMITPAISVLSAVEGLDVATPVFRPYIVPITLAVLVLLFVVQRIGTAKVGAMFGPVMMVWFAVISAIGVAQIVRAPHVLTAIDPRWAIRFFATNHVTGYLVLGAVFLAVTGGEALYADMGHFGARPIRLAWFFLVFPALLLNYFGQGALMLRDLNAFKNPFFLAAPAWALYPLVGLSTIATIIASQAVISGAFSLTRQAVQLGYLPRLVIRHTSAREIGQIYIPSVNWLLMICAVGLVIAFQASTNLAAAYGVAVTATMAITTSILAVVERERWRWSTIAIVCITVPLLFVDLAFFGANIIKVEQGGWFPLLVGVLAFALMSTWRRGRQILNERLAATQMEAGDLLRDLAAGRVPRVPGTAIFMSRRAEGIPTSLLHNLKHNKVVHKNVVLLSVVVEEIARLPENERVQWEELGQGVFRLVLRFGYMDETNLPSILASIKDPPVPLEPMITSYFLGRETLLATRHPGMALWRERLFAWMMRNATGAATYFSLPSNQVIELGAQIEM
jgi:KUP system potassium uptake protein